MIGLQNKTPAPQQVPAKPEPQDKQTTSPAKTEAPIQQTVQAGKPGIVPIPAGYFWMGCNEEVDKECKNEEKPGREVYLDSYAIDINEVTVAEYRRCVKAGACSTTGLTEYPPCNWDDEGRENHPIRCVDWQQASTYCQWAGKRLPTEVEWEKAARGTDGRIYSWGNEWDKNKANVGGMRRTTAVGSYPAGKSPYGVYDMTGNVWEWVQDWYAAENYKQGPARNPKGPDSGTLRVQRGGSWSDGPKYTRVSYRRGDDPGLRSDNLGFRCAR